MTLEELEELEEGDFYGQASLAPTPTRAVPGTADKLVVMMSRAAHRQQVTHPFDSRYEGDTLPDQWDKMSEVDRIKATRPRLGVLVAARKASEFYGDD